MPYADKGGGEFCRGVSHEVSLLILDTDFLLVLALSTWMRCVASGDCFGSDKRMVLHGW